MPMHTRLPWLAHIEALDVPPWLKAHMREIVHVTDLTLSITLGNMALGYYRALECAQQAERPCSHWSIRDTGTRLASQRSRNADRASCDGAL